MKTLSSIFLFLCLLLAGTSTFAHNMWIETAPTGKSGKEQSAKVYLGGYAENERDSTAHWFSNTKDFTLWLIEPNGTKKQLTTKALGNCYEAVFTPTADGVYTLTLTQELADVYGTTKYIYYAVAPVQVGSLATGRENVNTVTALSIKTTGDKKVPNNTRALIHFHQKQVANASLTIGSPTGWLKTIPADEAGIASFETLWKGYYVLEGHYTEQAAGTHNGKEYKTVKHLVTYSTEL